MPWALASIAILLAGAAATPIAYPAFPATTDFSTVNRWLTRQTDIRPGELLDVRGGFAFVTLAAAAPQGPRTLRLEAVDAHAWMRIGGRSAELAVQLACAPARLTPVDLVVYAASNRMGPARRDLDPAALRLSPGDLSVVAAALCTPGVQARPPVAYVPPPVPTEREPPPFATVIRDETIRVQVGAYVTPLAAMNAIQRLETVSPGLLDSRLNRLEPVRVGKRTVYRALITGFSDDADAARFCQALIRAHRLCLVRRPR